MCRGERGILFAAMHGVKLRCSAIDLKMENVGPVVMASEIVPQLHCDPKLEIALGIKDAFLGSHRSGQSESRRTFSAAGEGSSSAIICSSTVPQAEITKALLIWAKAWESMVTRLRSGSPPTGEGLG